jgi:UDP-N-acetylglucosamine acyltransferase
MDIHKTAIINPKAEIGKNVKIGPYTIVEDDVVIEDDCEISSSALIASGTRIGEKCRVFHGAVLGSIPQDLKFGGEKTSLEIGKNTTIREFATLNRGTEEKWKTVIGNNCLLMAYSHIAHDCILGNNVIIANSVNMAGHVIIDDFVGIGGICPVHQFVRIGKHAFIGGGSKVSKDVPPFVLAMGEPFRFAGLNRVGLTRRGFSENTLTIIKDTYRIIIQSSLNLKDALKKIHDEIEPIQEVQDILQFYQDSNRGIIR